MGSRDLINKFTSGELDPKFIAEVDYDGYRKAARRLRNVISIPQAGVTRRFGTIFENIITDDTGTPITNIDEVRLIAYEHQNNEFYDIIIRSDPVAGVAIDIYLNALLQTTVLAPINTYIATDVRNIRWVKDYDRLFLLLGDVRPYQLRRITATNWTLIPITFVYFPTYDFTPADDPATFPTPNVPYTDPAVTFTPNALDATIITANIAVFTSNHVKGIYSDGTGIFRIESVNGAGTVATGFTIVDFADVAPIIGPLSYLAERAWNDGLPIGPAPAGISRGWPTHGCYYQSRLVLGGSPSLPGTAYASGVKEPFNFNDSEAEADNSWGVEIGVTGNDIIADILPTKSLVLLSNKGPASTSILLDSPTTPANAFLNTQGTEGSRNMNSVILDNQILYADRAGNTIWAMAYDLPDTGYTISNASILSTHLIRNPRWADIYDPDSIDGRYYLLVNSDGSLAIYNSIKDENIKAWTLARTLGSFIDVACVANQGKVLVRRKVGTIGPASDADAVYYVDSTYNAFTNLTAELDAAITPVPIFNLNFDYLLIGNEITFTNILFQLTQGASENLDLTYEFLTNTGAWEEFFPASDSTDGLQMSGTITWTQSQLSNWQSQFIVGTDPSYNELAPYYWIRIRRNNANNAITPIVQAININSSNRIYIERIDFETVFNNESRPVVMDCQIQTVSDVDGFVSGLDRLVGQNVFVFKDNFPLTTYYVDDFGTITIPAGASNVTVGLDYQTLVITMPLVAVLQNGYSVYEPVHVDNMYIDYYLSLGITVQGQNLPQVVPGAFMTDAIPVLVTGNYKIPTFNGWEPRAEFVISQSYPAPFTLLAVSYTMEVSP